MGTHKFFCIFFYIDPLQVSSRLYIDGHMLGRIHISNGCTHVSYPNTRCLHLLVFLLLVQLSAARVKLQYFPSQVSFIAFPPVSIEQLPPGSGLTEVARGGGLRALRCGTFKGILHFGKWNWGNFCRTITFKGTDTERLLVTGDFTGRFSNIVKIEDCDLFCVW